MMKSIFTFPFLLLIRCYQWFLSPLMPPTCRYYPSCSHYAVQALKTHGVVKGGWLALKRILSCHPWGGSGIDLVPEKLPSTRIRTETIHVSQSR